MACHIVRCCRDLSCQFKAASGVGDLLKLVGYLCHPRQHSGLKAAMPEGAMGALVGTIDSISPPFHAKGFSAGGAVSRQLWPPYLLILGIVVGLDAGLHLGTIFIRLIPASGLFDPRGRVGVVVRSCLLALVLNSALRRTVDGMASRSLLAWGHRPATLLAGSHFDPLWVMGGGPDLRRHGLFKASRLSAGLGRPGGLQKTL